jgi:hypothetical protein
MRVYVAAACGLLAFVSAVIYARLAYAGPERFTVVCGAATAYDTQAGTVVVPITVTMGSGQPDTIDMTYTAVDANNNPVSCDPASDKLSVSRGNPANDSVTITYGGPNPPVQFTASGTGECYGYDTDSSGASLFTGGVSGAAAAVAGANPITIGAQKVVKNYVVPVTVAVSGTGTPADRVAMSYTATDSGGGKVTCVPASESFFVTAPSLSVTHNVLVNYTAATGTVSFKAELKAVAAGTDFTNTGNLPLAATAAVSGGTAAETLTVTLGSASPPAPAITPSFNRYLVPVTVQLTSGTDRIRMKYSAVDGGNQELHCRPSSSIINATTTASQPQNVIVGVDGASGQVTFTASGHGDSSGVLTPATLTFTP